MKLPLLIGLVSAALSVGVATPVAVNAANSHNEIVLKAAEEEFLEAAEEEGIEEDAEEEAPVLDEEEDEASVARLGELLARYEALAAREAALFEENEELLNKVLDFLWHFEDDGGFTHRARRLGEEELAEEDALPMEEDELEEPAVEEPELTEEEEIDEEAVEEDFLAEFIAMLSESGEFADEEIAQLQAFADELLGIYEEMALVAEEFEARLSYVLDTLEEKRAEYEGVKEAHAEVWEKLDGAETAEEVLLAYQSLTDEEKALVDEDLQAMAALEEEIAALEEELDAVMPETEEDHHGHGHHHGDDGHHHGHGGHHWGDDHEGHEHHHHDWDDEDEEDFEIVEDTEDGEGEDEGLEEEWDYDWDKEWEYPEFGDEDDHHPHHGHGHGGRWGH